MGAWNLAGEELSAVKRDVIIIGLGRTGDLPCQILKGAVFIHPTLCQGLFKLLDNVKPVD